MSVARLMKPLKVGGKLMVQVRLKCLSNHEDSYEPIDRVYEYVPKLFLNLLDRRQTASDL